MNSSLGNTAELQKAFHKLFLHPRSFLQFSFEVLSISTITLSTRRKNENRENNATNINKCTLLPYSLRLFLMAVVHAIRSLKTSITFFNSYEFKLATASAIYSTQLLSFFYSRLRREATPELFAIVKINPSTILFLPLKLLIEDNDLPLSNVEKYLLHESSFFLENG